MAITYNFSLVSHQDTAPLPTLLHGWEQNFYPLQANAFDSLNIQLDLAGGWLTTANGKEGSTGDFYDLTGFFNNYGAIPVSYVVDFDRKAGPEVDPVSGPTHYGAPRNSTLIFGNSAGFLFGNYPAAFSLNSAQQPAPYTIGITPGAQAYSKSDPSFTIPYGIYSCPGKWSVKSFRATCSVTGATYRYKYGNTGTLALTGTQAQTVAAYTNVGYCAAGDGNGTVAVFTDTSGTIAMTLENHGTDALALAFVTQKFGSALPAGAQGFMRINVSQNYSDRLRITSGWDGVFDWSTLPQELEARTTWAGLAVSSPMSTQALYTITAVKS
jgi:hypothetical protein